MKKFMADFETDTCHEDETYVWAWATCSIDEDLEVEMGNTIESFMEWCYRNRNSEVYFHNEKFDGEFVLHYLLKHGFKHVEDKKEREDNTFMTIISDLRTILCNNNIL